jgi:hypothetical protein
MSCLRGKCLVRLAISLALLLLFLACNSSRSTKELTESSARELLGKRLGGDKYMVDVSQLGQLIVRTRVDYSSVGGGAQEQVVAKELLKDGSIIRSTEAVDYPSIAGDFAARIDKSFQPPNQDRWVTRWETKGWTVQNSPNEPMTLSGTVHSLTEEGEGKGPLSVRSSDQGAASGTVTPDGKVELIDTRFGWNVHRGTYSEDGPNAYLDFVGDDTYQKLTGKASGRKFQVLWYTYSFGPAFKSQIVTADNGTFVPGGDFTIGDVRDLRLVTETVAAARFAWEASLNSTGKTFLQNVAPKGTGMVSFAKKPDGGWFVDEIRFEGHSQPHISGRQ